MIRCLIIDDEPLAQNVLEAFIQRVNYLTLAAKCENAIDAFDIVHGSRIDLIFCDIEMPQITGIEFVKSLKNPPAIIFTTAFSEFALEGFNVDAVDYLVKPIAFERFLRSVNKVKNLLAANGTQQPKEAVQEKKTTHLFVKEDYKLVKINYSDIYYIEGMKDYVKIFTHQKTIITHITMKKLEEILPANAFCRIHKSFIVRLDVIKAINGNTIEILNNSKIPIGLQHRERLMRILNNIS